MSEESVKVIRNEIKAFQAKLSLFVDHANSWMDPIKEWTLVNGGDEKLQEIGSYLGPLITKLNDSKDLLNRAAATLPE